MSTAINLLGEQVEIVGNCATCGKPLIRKTANGKRNGRIPKYCCSNCRVADWRQKQKETE